MVWIITGIIISYLIGSIPTAYLFSRWLKGVDIRKCGSGNVGATNALRVLGKVPGIIVLLLDILKGFFVVVFVANLINLQIAFISSQKIRVIFGLFCITGHNWNIFLGFKGGKGIATTLGVLLGLAVKIAGLKIVLSLVILTWTVIFIITRIVSLASIAACLALPIYSFIFKLPKIMLVLSVIIALFILLRHKPNIERLLTKKEPRLF
ncbi:glycerol-3-phosphate 1-O-acyltransferase [bacterium]|nr:MAG: glycerol-3-phosphate 1-O-acyltransferase [bacterium]